MNTCPQCLNETDSTHCVFCGIQITTPDRSDFPPVTWSEIRDEFVRRVMIEDEWMVESEDSLTWWPGLVPQKLYVSSRIEIEVDDVTETLIRVTVESELGQATDRAKALSVVADLMIDYPFGSFVVLDDNTVLAVASVAIYGYSRSLIGLITEEALVQATFVQELAIKLASDGVVESTFSSHPVSGRRDDMDELVQNIYGNETFVPIHEGLVPMRELVREYWQKAILQGSVELGFKNDEVTFVTYEDRFDCGVGWRDDEFCAQKFGPSLMVWNNLAQTQNQLTDEEMNSLNLMIAFEFEYGLGHIGGVTQQQLENWNAIQHVAVLPFYFLQSGESGFEGAIMKGFNGILQASACARYAYRLLNRATEPQLD